MSTELISALVTLVVPAVLYVLRQVVLVRLAPRQLGLVQELARAVVGAAEEVGRSLDLKGADKYEYAEQALVTAAKRAGVRLKPEEANAFIHSVIREFQNFNLADYLEENTPEAATAA